MTNQTKPNQERIFTDQTKPNQDGIFTAGKQKTKEEIDDGPIEQTSHIVYDVEDAENEDLRQIQDMLLAEEIEISDDEDDSDGDVEVKEVLDEKDVGESMIGEDVGESNDGEDVREQGDVFEVEVKLEEKLENDETIPEFCCLCYNPFEGTDVEKHNAEVHSEDQEALTMVFSDENLCFNCNFCPLRFLSENLLSTHTRTQHMATITVIDCEICGKSVRSKQLSKHMQTHQEKKFECKLCYKKFSIQKYLEDHQKNVHRGEQHLFEQNLTESDLIFECENDQCDKKFASEQILNYHKKHGHKETSFYCTFCPQIFARVTILRNHCKQVHGRKISHTGKENICKLCYNAFEKKTNLKTFF